MDNILYTIGHSNHPIQHFLSLLQLHGITALCDVRSYPYSRYAPQYSKDSLNTALNAADIAYVYLGKELGGKTTIPECIADGKVSYARLALHRSFNRGLDRLKQGVQQYNIAIMCAEKDPMHCHRALLVGRSISAQGISVQHIHAEGETESQLAFEDRLLKTTHLMSEDMFSNRNELLAQAYAAMSGQSMYFVNAGATDLSP